MTGDDNLIGILETPIALPEPGYEIQIHKVYAIVEKGSDKNNEEEGIDFDISLRTGRSLKEIENHDHEGNYIKCKNGTRLVYADKKGQYVKIGLQLREFNLARRVRIEYEILGKAKVID